MKVSLVLDSVAVPAWVAEVVRRLLRNPLVQIASVATTGVDPKPSESLPLLYRAYVQWDERRNTAKFNPLETVDLANELAGIPQISSDEIDSDLLVWLSSSQPQALSGRTLAFGLLRFVASDPRRQNSGPPYYWELFRQEPISGSAWELLPGTGGDPFVAAEGYSATEIGWSLRLNQTSPYSKAPALLERSLYELCRRSPAKAREDIPPAGVARPKPAGDVRCTKSLRLGSFIGKNVTRSLHRRLAYRGKEPYWFVAYRSDPNRFLRRTGQFHTDGFKAIEPPEGSFLADPFLIAQNGKNFIFVEDYPYREGKGVISVLEVDANGQIGSAERVLERPYHLSYPFVFEHEGSIYMIPETMGSRRIELYEAKAFPSRWELVHVLKEDIEAVDTTLWIQDGIYYFFTNVAELGATPNDLLYLYISDSLCGEWIPHPANPICADVRSSRSAGCLFVRQNRIIRPAQDCSIRYGYACQLNEIQTLSPTEYRERPVGRIDPNWHPGLIGTHTINSNETIEVIDGQIYKSRYG
ncbi:MAG: hypothetical protein ACJ746_14470 [Bryobacteraceae bacterium]